MECRGNLGGVTNQCRCEALSFLFLRGMECRGNLGGVVVEGLFPLHLPSAEIASSLMLLAKTGEFEIASSLMLLAKTVEA